jgi:hypothetical protein
MGFGENDGTLNSAKKGIRKFAGCRSLIPGELSRNGLKFFREAVRHRLEHARDGFLHAGIRLGEFLREDPPKGIPHSKASESTSPNARERQAPFQQDP